MALSYGASFVARLFAGDPESITAALKEGIRHEGFSFYHVYTSCVTFDKQFKTWKNLKERVHPLPANHNTSNLKNAMNIVLEDNFAMGIVYRRN